MWRHDQATAALLQSREIGERADVLGASFVIEQQDVLALDGPLDAGDQHQSPFGGIRAKLVDV